MHTKLTRFAVVLCLGSGGCFKPVGSLRDAGADAGTDAVADAGAVADADAGAVADAGVVADAGADAGADADAGSDADAAIVLPTVGFSADASVVGEGAGQAMLEVRLNAPSGNVVTVAYFAAGGNAYGPSNCFDGAFAPGSGRDFALDGGVLTFQPGTTVQSIPVTVTDDTINEVDETVEVVLTNPTNASLGQTTTHLLTIADNDRKNLVDVKVEFDASGDGTTDDTAAIQRAADWVSDAGGGVIVFPPGVYIVTSVRLRENITYQGNDATIKRPDKLDASASDLRWRRTFTAQWSSTEDSLPLIIRGLTFDGNSSNQGPYKNYELEHAHLVFLEALQNSSGRLTAIVEDCQFRNGVADAISVYTNVNASVYNNVVTDSYRGGFVLTGGHSIARVCELRTEAGPLGDDTGIDIEVDGVGYGGDKRIDLTMDRLNLLSGDFDVGVQPGSIVVGSNIVSAAPFNIYAYLSKVTLRNAQFKVGEIDGSRNRILCPNDLTIKDSRITVTRKQSSGGSVFSAADIWWSHGACDAGAQTNQSVVFDNVEFAVDNNFDGGESIYLLYARNDSSINNNRLVVDGGSIGAGFAKGLVMTGGGLWSLRDVALGGSIEFTWDGGTTQLTGVNGFLTTEIAH